MGIDKLLSSPSPPSGEPGTILLGTERLILRRYLPSDASIVAAAANYPSVAASLRDGFPSPYTLASAESFLSRAALPVATSYPHDAAIFVKPTTSGKAADADGEAPLYIGALSLVPKDDIYYRTWELGYWLTPSAWGQGYGTEAVEPFVRWAFETWPRLNRIEAQVFSGNERSGRILEKCGFIVEGRMRGNTEKLGELRDEFMYGLIRSDLHL